MKLLHIGLCVQPPPYNGMQTPFYKYLGVENYREISTGEKDLNNKVFTLFNEFKPDKVFMQVQAPNIMKPELVKHMSNTCTIINWTGDVRHEVPKWMVEIAPYCISSFSNDTDVQTMKRLGYDAEYLEIGYDPLIYCPSGDKANCPEIIFMANNYGKNYFPLSNYRIDIVNKLTNIYGSRFGVYGNGWQTAKGNINHSQSEEAKYYRNCKVAINCSHFDYSRYSSDRLLRILGTAAFCLSHNYKDIAKDYEIGKHLDHFVNVNDLVDKINYYLQLEDKRNQIAKQGNELVKNRNTFTHMIKNIIAL